jgi:hypothetical protein
MFTSPAQSLITIGAPNVALVTLKRAGFENPGRRDLILRLQEMTGQPATDVVITLPFAITSAEIDGLGEQRTGAIPLRDRSAARHDRAARDADDQAALRVAAKARATAGLRLR